MIVHWIKDWGTTNGDEILINADLDDVIGQVPFVRNRIPDISLKHLRLQAQALIAGPADPQMGG